jgi:uncharacterized protein (TIGR02001 family)
MARRGAAARGTLGIAGVLALALPAAGAAAEVRYEVGLLSHYVWRGITLTEDPVLQPSVEIAHASGVTFEVWGNVDLGDDNDTEWELNEARLVVDYGRRVGDLELGVGLVEYLFPGTPFPGTRELSLRLGYDALVSPRLEVFYDVDEIEGAYARLALTYERALRARWRGAVEASAGWADDAFSIGGEGGLHDGGLEVRIERTAGRLELRFLARWSGSLDSEVLPDQPASCWAGLVLGVRL